MEKFTGVLVSVSMLFALSTSAYAICLPGEDCTGGGDVVLPGEGEVTNPLDDIVSNLPAGTQTEQNSDGSFTTTLPSVNVEGSTSTTTIVTTANTANIEVNVEGVGVTKINIPFTPESVEIGDDGSITQNMKIGNVPVVATLKPNGDAEMSLTKENGEVQKVKLPIGANFQVNEDGSVAIDQKITSNAGTEYQVNIKADANGKMTAKVTGSDGKVKELATYDNVVESLIEYINFVNESVADMRALLPSSYDAIASSFKSSRNFVVSERRGVDLSVGKDIEIEPLDGEANFQEILTLEGDRYIKLPGGTARLVVDGEAQEMDNSKTYLIPVNDITPEEGLKNKTASVNGYYVYYGVDGFTDAYKWAYITNGLVFKFEPQNESGIIPWKQIDLSVEISSDGKQAVFSEATMLPGDTGISDAISALSGATKEINGYYVYYGNSALTDAYMWVYITGNYVFKFEPQNEDGTIPWKATEMSGVLNGTGDKIDFQ